MRLLLQSKTLAEHWIASIRKLKPTCQSVWPGLACTWVDMWWLALSLLEIKSRPGDASISPFGQPTQVNVSWETSSRCYSNLKFCNLRVLPRRLASQFGHSKQASAQVQLAASCEFLPVHLLGEDWHFRGEVRLWCLSYNSFELVHFRDSHLPSVPIFAKLKLEHKLLRIPIDRKLSSRLCT